MESKDIPWYYGGIIVTPETVPEGVVGMVYRITTYPTSKARDEVLYSYYKSYDKFYIGKKLLTSTRKTKISKREIKATKTRKRVKKVVKDSGWMTYNSSSTEVQKICQESPELILKEVLHWCYNKKQMSYWETKEMMLHGWEDVFYSLNDHCQNWWRKDLIKPNQNGTI